MAFHHSPKIVTNGLVLCLDAANRKSYSGTGTVWRDLAEGNSGTLTNGPTFNSANGGSIVFDGVNDFVNLSRPSTLNFGTGSFSISIWFFITTGNILRTMASKGATSATNSSGWWIALDNRYNSNVNGISFSVNSTSVNTSYAAVGTVLPYNTGRWNNIVTIWNSTTKNALIYLNTFLMATTVVQIAGSGLAGVTNTDNSSFDNIIGAYDNGTSIHFPGNMSQVTIYNRALSPAEVLQNYNATKGRFNL